MDQLVFIIRIGLRNDVLIHHFRLPRIYKDVVNNNMMREAGMTNQMPERDPPMQLETAVALEDSPDSVESRKHREGCDQAATTRSQAGQPISRWLVQLRTINE